MKKEPTKVDLLWALVFGMALGTIALYVIAGGILAYHMATRDQPVQQEVAP